MKKENYNIYKFNTLTGEEGLSSFVKDNYPEFEPVTNLLGKLDSIIQESGIIEFGIYGGCFKDLLLGKEPKDYDLFVNNSGITDYTTLKEKIGECLGYYESVYYRDQEKSITKSSEGLKFDSGIFIDLVLTKLYGNYLVEHFDLDISQIAIFYSDNSYYFLYHKDFLESVKNKRMSITNISNPISTFDRVLKYSNYGFVLDRESKKKLLYDLIVPKEIGGNDDIDISIGFY